MNFWKRKKKKAGFRDMYCSLLGLIIRSEHFSNISPPAALKGSAAHCSQYRAHAERSICLCLRLQVLITLAGWAAWRGAGGGVIAQPANGLLGLGSRLGGGCMSLPVAGIIAFLNWLIGYVWVAEEVLMW